MTGRPECALIGKWRIVEADPWDNGYLDPVESVHVTIVDHEAKLNTCRK